MSPTLERIRKDEFKKGKNSSELTQSQLSKMKDLLNTVQKELKGREATLPTDEYSNQNNLDFKKTSTETHGKRNSVKKTLNENKVQNKNREKDLSMNTSRKRKKKKSYYDQEGNLIHVEGSELPRENTTGLGADGIVYYKKKKIKTTPEYTLDKVEEFIPAKKKRKHKDDDTDMSIKYIYEKKKKKKKSKEVQESFDSNMDQSFKVKRKKKNDLDNPSDLETIPEKEIFHKKKKKHKDKVVDNQQLVYDIKIREGKHNEEHHKKNKKTKLGINKLLEEENYHFTENPSIVRKIKIIPGKPNQNMIPIRSEMQETKENTIVSKKKSKNKLDTHVDKEEIIEDFLMQISLDHSFANKNKNDNRNCTIQNFESTNILELENMIETEVSNKAAQGQNDLKSKNKKKNSKTISDRSDQDSMMDNWFSHAHQKGNESKKIKGPEFHASVLEKNRRKSEEIPKTDCLLENNKRHSLGYPMNTKMADESRSKQLTKTWKDHPIAKIKKHNMEETYAEGKKNETRKVMKTAKNDEEEFLNVIIRELKDEIGLPELLDILKEQQLKLRESTKRKSYEKSSSNNGVKIQKNKELSEDNQNNPFNTKNRSDKPDIPKTTPQVKHIENENNMEVKLNAETENKKKSNSGPNINNTKLDVLRDNMDEDIKNLIESAVAREKTIFSKGNLESDINKNNVNGIIYRKEIIDNVEVVQGHETHLDNSGHCDTLKESVILPICDFDNDSNCSWQSVPTHIKQSPLSIKPEDYSNDTIQTNDFDNSHEFVRLNQIENHEIPEIDNNFLNAFINIKKEYTNGDNSRGQSVYSSVYGSSDDELLDVFNSNTTINFEAIRDMQELSEDQIKLLQKLTVFLPFSPPHSHCIETRMSSSPTKEQLKQFGNLGIKMKKGKYTMEEDALIRRNWLEFIKVHNIPNDPLPFINFVHPKITAISILSTTNRIKFVQFLGRDLNNRMLYSIHSRFKLLFKKLRKGKFTIEEDNIITNYMLAHAGDFKTYSKLAEQLNRTRTSIEKRYEHLIITTTTECQKNVGNDVILKEIMQEIRCVAVKPLKNKCLSWQQFVAVAKRVNMYPYNVKKRWQMTIYPTLFSKVRDVTEIKRRLVTLLLEDGHEDNKAVRYSDYVKYFDGTTSAFLYNIMQDMIRKRVPSRLQNDFRDSLIYLKDHYLDKLRPSIISDINIPDLPNLYCSA